MQGAGKVKVGQVVNIKFDNFPYMEFGVVKGIVKSISLVTNDSNYIVEVSFPNGLKTNYGKNLLFSRNVRNSRNNNRRFAAYRKILNPIKSILAKFISVV